MSHVITSCAAVLKEPMAWRSGVMVTHAASRHGTGMRQSGGAFTFSGAV